MSAPGARRVLVLGGGPAGRAAMAVLPGARLVTRPLATAWHAEPGRLWLEDGARVWAEAFDDLIICADEPLLLASLGCAVVDGRILIDPAGRTSRPGIHAAGRVAGAASADAAAAQGRVAAETVRDGAPGPLPHADPPPPGAVDRLDPLDMAMRLERPAGPARDAEILAQSALLGPILPARPVSLAALAASVAVAPPPLPPQSDEGRLA